MLLNYETVLVGTRCVLVPYRRQHVSKYHDWMQDPALLQATGSEPLSLVDEYEMQQSWRDDSNKCTFIVLARDADEECRSLMHRLLLESSNEMDNSSLDETFIVKTLSAMAGDVNLFLSDEETSEHGDEVDHSASSTTAVYRQAELDIMIAEKAYQRQGLGKEASLMMMLYAAKNLSIRRFFCKINEDNESSISLFRKLGFEQCAYATCFKQYEFELKKETQEDMIDFLTCAMDRKDMVSLQCVDGDEDKK